jgi:hypothetical protein
MLLAAVASVQYAFGHSEVIFLPAALATRALLA